MASKQLTATGHEKKPYDKIGDVARVLGPDTIGSSQGKGAGKIVLRAHASSNRGGFFELVLELGASIFGEGSGKGDGQCWEHG